MVYHSKSGGRSVPDALSAPACPASGKHSPSPIHRLKRTDPSARRMDFYSCDELRKEIGYGLKKSSFSDRNGHFTGLLIAETTKGLRIPGQKSKRDERETETKMEYQAASVSGRESARPDCSPAPMARQIQRAAFSDAPAFAKRSLNISSCSSVWR